MVSSMMLLKGKMKQKLDKQGYKDSASRRKCSPCPSQPSHRLPQQEVEVHVICCHYTMPANFWPSLSACYRFILFLSSPPDHAHLSTRDSAMPKASNSTICRPKIDQKTSDILNYKRKKNLHNIVCRCRFKKLPLLQ